ncbi:MAG TPA: hypothetical protein VK978_00790 [Candidatus Saccharimonadales bacterium]|nr:hypothetical protein [Candidatus Saccharimonadales bacterium]
MLTLQLFSWWYGPGWQQTAQNAWQAAIKVSHIFSVPILLRTLWAPWRRIVTYPGASIDAKLRAMGDNLVSRCIGFTVRMLVLLTAGIIMLLTILFGALLVVVWPLVPVLIPLLVIKAVLG